MPRGVVGAVCSSVCAGPTLPSRIPRGAKPPSALVQFFYELAQPRVDLLGDTEITTVDTFGEVRPLTEVLDEEDKYREALPKTFYVDRTEALAMKERTRLYLQHQYQALLVSVLSRGPVAWYGLLWRLCAHRSPFPPQDEPVLELPESEILEGPNEKCANTRFDWVFVDTGKGFNDATGRVHIRQKDGTLRTPDKDERNRFVHVGFSRALHLQGQASSGRLATFSGLGLECVFVLTSCVGVVLLDGLSHAQQDDEPYREKFQPRGYL